MDKQIIEGLNIFAKYDVDGDRIEMGDENLIIYYSAFRKEDREKLKELGWIYEKDSNTDYYYHEV